MNNWMDEENERAKSLSQTGKTTNDKAPRIKSVSKEISTKRSIRSVYIKESHQRMLDKLIFEQKMVGGKKAPELLEEAIELMIEKYNIE
jgi:hypothetical protein